MKFGDAANLVKESVRPSAVPHDFPYIGLEHIEQENLQISHVGKSADVTSGKQKFQNGDILFGKLRPYFRKVASPNFEGICSTDIWVIRPKNGYDAKFLFYWCASWDFVNYVNSASEGTRMPRAKWSVAAHHEITERSFAEQKAIGIILNALDEKIKINAQMSEALEEMAQAIFKSWFIDFDPVRAKMEKRPTGLSNVIESLFPADSASGEKGEIPSGWKVSRLQNLDIEIESGRRPKGGIDKSLSTGVPSIGAESIAPAGIFDYSKTKYITEEFAATVERGRVKNFDVALYKDGQRIGETGYNIPRVAIYGEGFPFEVCLVNEHVFLLRSKKLGQPFLYYLMSSNGIIDQIIARASAKAAQPGLNQGEVLSSTFILPDLRLVEQFNRIAEPILKRQFLLGKENEILTNLRDLLLPNLISGKISVPEAEKIVGEQT